MAIKHLEELKSDDFFKRSGLFCVVREMRAAPSNIEIAMHGHEFSELVVVASGQLNHIHAAGTERLASGDFFVIHPGERHGYAELARRTVVFNLLYHHTQRPPALALGDFPVAAACFPTDPAASRVRTLGRVPRRDIPHVVALIKAIRRESETCRPFGNSICMSLFSALVMRLSRHADAASAAPNLPIDRELDFIARNLGGKITLGDICAVSGRSVSSLSRAFRKSVGASPYDHVIALRVAKARSLIADGRLPLGEVAARTGFCDASHLARTLRAHEHGG